MDEVLEYSGGVLQVAPRKRKPEGCPDKVNEHDFADKNLGKAVPYGVYDIAANAGCVSVGIDNDTAQFSVDPALAGCDGA